MLKKYLVGYLIMFLSFNVIGQELTTYSDTSVANKTEDLGEFVITGQYSPQSMRNSVYKINIINQEKIQAKAASSVQQILNTELGIRFSNDMALGVSDVAMMGMSGRNLKILVDGVPILDRGDMRESLNQIDVSQIEKIELVEGPMSIVYGTDALAGVINIITKRTQASSWMLNARIQVETVGKEYKPFGAKGLHTQFVSGQWDNGAWNVLMSMNHYDFKGFGADGHNRNHSWKPKEQWIPTLKVGYRNAHFSIYYRPDYLYETIWTKGAINMDNYKGSNKKFVTQKHSHQLHLGYVINDKLNLNVVSSLSDYMRKTETFIKNFATQEQFLSTGQGEQDIATFTSFNFRSTVQYKLRQNLSFQPGVEINYESASGDRMEGNPSFTDLSVFLSAEYKPTQKVNLRPGVRMTKNSLYNAPPIIPSLNLLYHLDSKYSLRLSYARGYRAPALRELYFDFVDANHNLKGNPNLEAENSHSFNGSLTYQTHYDQNMAINAEIGGFYNYFDNLISTAANPLDPTQFINVNINQYKTTGFSWRNRLKLDSWELGLNALLLGQYNEMAKFAYLIPNEKIPHFTWSPEWSLELIYSILRIQTKIAAFYKYVGVRQMYHYTTDSSGETDLYIGKMGSYHILDMSLNQKINNRISLQLGARNLFDVVNINNSGVRTGGAHSSGGSTPFGYGRSYFIAINFLFNKYL